MKPHTPLHLIDHSTPCTTAGRLHLSHTNTWKLKNAMATVTLHFTTPPSPEHHLSLAQVTGVMRNNHFDVEHYTLHEVLTPEPLAPTDHISSRCLRAREQAIARIRQYFQSQHFLEVSTPALVDEPGTDVFLEPFATPFIPEEEVTLSAAKQRPIQGYLNTSPEFLMKRLLGQGYERIWQMTRAWRNGEVTDLHAPEFTCLEWYRAWEPLEHIIHDTETIIRRVIGTTATFYDMHHERQHLDISKPFKRITMQEFVQECCGFDILNTPDAESFAEEVYSRGLLRRRRAGVGTNPMFGEERLGEPVDLDEEVVNLEAWLAIFFELQVTHLDDYLANLGAVVLTHWPTQLAVLAAKNEDDPRVADRFEIYIGGVECANGFRELTDAVEQRTRFEQDLQQRRQLGRPMYPMPHKFLSAMERGFPPSSGVALGFDRVLMLATGSRTIREVLPFSMHRPHGHGPKGPSFG